MTALGTIRNGNKSADQQLKSKYYKITTTYNLHIFNSLETFDKAINAKNYLTRLKFGKLRS